jgi:putative PIN family toxin of toxin-antitoxin system
MNPEKLRVVFDTNVMVSRFLFRKSIPAQAVLCAEQIGVILISDATINELVEVLNRPKLKAYTVDRAKVTGFLSNLIDDAEPVALTASVQACRDPKDDKFLALAISGKADCIVTGDDDLLTLNPFQGIAILTPREFLDRYKSDE